MFRLNIIVLVLVMSWALVKGAGENQANVVDQLNAIQAKLYNIRSGEMTPEDQKQIAQMINNLPDFLLREVKDLFMRKMKHESKNDEKMLSQLDVKKTVPVKQADNASTVDNKIPQGSDKNKPKTLSVESKSPKADDQKIATQRQRLPQTDTKTTSKTTDNEMTSKQNGNTKTIVESTVAPKKKKKKNAGKRVKFADEQFHKRLGKIREFEKGSAASEYLSERWLYSFKVSEEKTDTAPTKMTLTPALARRIPTITSNQQKSPRKDEKPKRKLMRKKVMLREPTYEEVHHLKWVNFALKHFWKTVEDVEEEEEEGEEEDTNEQSKEIK